MKMLAELGLEFISLAQHGGRTRADAEPSTESVEPPPPDRGGTGQAGG